MVKVEKSKILTVQFLKLTDKNGKATSKLTFGGKMKKNAKSAKKMIAKPT